MKHSIYSAMFLAAFATGCAPVSTSVPKGQKTIDANPMYARGKVRSSGDIKGRDVSDQEKEKLKKTHQILELSHDQESRLIEMKELTIRLGVKSGAEAVPVQVTVFIQLGLADREIQSERVEKFKLDVTRETEGGDTFLIQVPKGTDEAWAYIRKNNPRISIAYREK